jgi:hypothetical protein
VDDHVLVNGRTRKRSAAGGWSEAEVCAEELPLRGRPCMEDNGAASGSSCWPGRRSTARRKEPWPNDNNIAPIARSNRGYERINQLVLMAYSMENSNVLSYSLKMDILTVLLVRLKTSDHCVNPVES